MSEVKLGRILTDDKGTKDAIHIAVIPLIAGEDLRSGEKIKLKFNSENIALSADYDEQNAFGIVDPFLINEDRYVEKGQRFYGLLFPGTVTGMRHEWQHPIFNAPKKEICEHEAWIRNFCDEWNFDYDELIRVALSDEDYKETYGRYIVSHGHDLHHRNELGPDHDLFWEHLEALTNKKFNQDHRDGMGWSCTC
jgi:hypothetical protein